jgi:hypothetical protein
MICRQLVGEAKPRMSPEALLSPEDRLLFNIVKQAIRDNQLKKGGDKRSAKLYLQGDMIHAQMIGLNVEWVKKQLTTAGMM